MEGIPSGDIQSKYQKLATEYSKLRVHVKVLKKGVLDEQARSNELKDLLKEKEKALRKNELEIDSLTFRNQQLTRRVSFLQEELENLQLKSTKKSKSKNDEKVSSSNMADYGLLQEELQKKIIENAQYASELSDRVFEVSQLKATLEDYERIFSEGDSKSKCEIAKLKNKIQELQHSLDEAAKERNNGTPKMLPTSSQAASCNGDFISEAGSLLGSEDALSSMDDLHLQDQVSGKTHSTDLDNQKLRMEYDLLQMDIENLRLELANHTSTTKSKNDGHDSGDFNNFTKTSMDSKGRLVGLLGSLEVPFVLSDEVEAREERIMIYLRNKLTALHIEKERIQNTNEVLKKECELYRIRFAEMERDRQTDEQTIETKHNTIRRLEEELHSTSSNYEEQMSVLSEHLASLNDKITKQHDEIQRLKHKKK